MALVQQTQLQTGGSGARDSARRITGSPALRMVGRRLLAAIPVLIGVTLLTFTIMSALPNTTAQAILGLNASPGAVAALNHTLGLDQPFFVRYWHWLVNVLHGNLGTSIQGQSVNHELAIHVPTTLVLLLYALVVSVVLAILVAALAARRPNGIADRISLAVSMLGLSIAPYAFAFLLIIVFAVKLGWFPVLSGAVPGPASFFKNLTLPAAAIGFGLFAIYTRLLRADIVEQMQREDYIVTAKAKGVAPWRGLFRHALPNLPVHPHHRHRAEPRRTGRRGGHHRDDLPGAGHRQRPADRHRQPRRAPGRGNHADLRARDLARQPPGRPGLRGTRPKDPVWQLHFLKQRSRAPSRHRCPRSSTAAGYGRSGSAARFGSGCPPGS